MSARPRKRIWRITCRLFRWCRIATLLVILTLMILIIWLHRYGLPEFVRDRLVAELRLRGLDVNFTRMRLVWYRGIVADHVQFGMAAESHGMRASATEAEVHLFIRPLLRRQLELEGVALRGGNLLIPVWGTNATPRQLTINGISGELRFRTNDTWELSDLKAEAFGVKLALGGAVTNASIIRSWKWSRQQAEATRVFWHDLVRDVEKTKFEAPTTIAGTIHGDARHIETFRANLTIVSPGLDSPWGKGRNLNLTARVRPEPGKLIRADLKLEAQQADTRWGQANILRLEAQVAPSLTQWTPTNAHLSLQVKQARTPWGDASSLVLDADFQPKPADAAVAIAGYTIHGQQVRTKWARFAQLNLDAKGVVSASTAWPESVTAALSFAGGEIASWRAASGQIEASLQVPPERVIDLANTNISWWSRLDMVHSELSIRLQDAHSPRMDIKSIALKSSWQAPRLLVRELDAQAFGGTLRGSGTLDAVTRVLSTEFRSDIDPQYITPLLNTNGRRWSTQVKWDQAPNVSAASSITLPVWTNSSVWQAADWGKEVLPTLSVAGNFQTGPVSYNNVGFSAAHSDFTCTNETWRVPNLVIIQPEGQMHVSLVTRAATGEYQFLVDSGIDLRVMLPLVPEKVQEVLNDFTLTSPPAVQAEIGGFWARPELTTLRATFAGTNMGFRSQLMLSCSTTVTLTNDLLRFVDPEVIRIEGTGRAESIVLDLPRHLLYINQASGNLDPVAVTKCVGPHATQLMAPYRFFNPPQSRVHGFVGLDDGAASDLRFHLEGGPFEWRSFRFQQITGDVHWVGDSLTLSNITANFHDGQMESSAAFDLSAKKGADFAFRVGIRNMKFHSFIAGLGNVTNRLEGLLTGLLVVTNANTEVPSSWFGYGHATLLDGYIWEMPVFGLFSPILNTIKPGAGNARAREASASFIITNGVILSDDLRIHASGMQLNYSGTVDFDTRVNGKMEAELFRNTPGVGPVVSKVLWPFTKLFEYKITGTLEKPKAQPLFIPKLFLMPFHPLRTLRELVGEDQDALDQKP